MPRTLTALLLVVLLAGLSGCESVPDEPRARDGRRAARAEASRGVPEVPERERVLHAYRAAATALRTGQYEVAKARLDDAIARIGGIIANDADAARARGLFSAESTKVFIGEPYERVMAYYYRGILYWRDGEPDNARACFRSGQVIDSGPEQEKYDADYVLLDYLDGLASAKLQADGGDAWARAQAHAGEKVALPPYNPAANVLVFAEYGYGPRKYAAGPYGEQLRFHVEDSPSRTARLVLNQGRMIVPLPPYDDLGYQATTRGGRVMDHILGNKAVFKAGADVAGDVALAGAAIAHDQSRRRERRGKDGDDAEAAAIGLGILGVIGKVAAAATRPEADTRQWNNLPQRLSFAALKLAPGEYSGRIEFLDRDGHLLPARTRPVAFTVAGDERDTVVFFSELTG
ncbi:MAG: hypothetical protein HZC55_00960 [Verrucomicrobia bacterium]|nr:hypothetical protein [Verrucomicrobiota bacterium]